MKFEVLSRFIEQNRWPTWNWNLIHFSSYVTEIYTCTCTCTCTVFCTLYLRFWGQVQKSTNWALIFRKFVDFHAETITFFNRIHDFSEFFLFDKKIAQNFHGKTVPNFKENIKFCGKIHIENPVFYFWPKNALFSWKLMKKLVLLYFRYEF